ncbi:MAG TPA: hypothetical protein VHX38_02785 [Pseudonocardiaceae bacterium]|nr:hypothetical protein [Pseudonocardiaceae bacterium]
MSRIVNVACAAVCGTVVMAALGAYITYRPAVVEALGNSGITEDAIGPALGAGPATHRTSGLGPSSMPGIPATALAYYREYGRTCPGLDWAALAGIGAVETNHGQSHLPGVHSGANYAGARGPMQFEPGTFAAVRYRHPDIGPNIYSLHDAIHAAAHKLCDDGFSHSPYRAYFAYNHAGWYVREVEARAARYRAEA